MRVYIALTLIFVAIAQDALLSPTEPFKISYNQHHSHEQTYVVQFDTQKYISDWSSLFVMYQGKHTNTIVTIDFQIVSKYKPDKNGNKLPNCKFEGIAQKWHSIFSGGVFNIQHHLLKVHVSCVSQCKFDITFGLTRRQWNKKDKPKLIYQNAQKSHSYQQEKKQVIIFKILGLMFLTLVLILAAIKLAVWVADLFDDNHKKVQKNIKKNNKID